MIELPFDPGFLIYIFYQYYITIAILSGPANASVNSHVNGVILFILPTKQCNMSLKKFELFQFKSIYIIRKYLEAFMYAFQ